MSAVATTSNIDAPATPPRDSTTGSDGMLTWSQTTAASTRLVTPSHTPPAGTYERDDRRRIPPWGTPVVESPILINESLCLDAQLMDLERVQQASERLQSATGTCKSAHQNGAIDATSSPLLGTDGTPYVYHSNSNTQSEIDQLVDASSVYDEDDVHICDAECFAAVSTADRTCKPDVFSPSMHTPLRPGQGTTLDPMHMSYPRSQTWGLMPVEEDRVRYVRGYRHAVVPTISGFQLDSWRDQRSEFDRLWFSHPQETIGQSVRGPSQSETGTVRRGVKDIVETSIGMARKREEAKDKKAVKDEEAKEKRYRQYLKEAMRAEQNGASRCREVIASFKTLLRLHPKPHVCSLLCKMRCLKKAEEIVDFGVRRAAEARRRAR